MVAAVVVVVGGVVVDRLATSLLLNLNTMPPQGCTRFLLGSSGNDSKMIRY